jgi:hypothetical protein
VQCKCLISNVDLMYCVQRLLINVSVVRRMKAIKLVMRFMKLVIMGEEVPMGGKWAGMI